MNKNDEKRTSDRKRSTKKSRLREQLLLALLNQPSLEKAAAAVGVSAVTAWRISKTPEFQREHREARRQAMEQSQRRLQQGCGAAAVTLIKVMMDANSPPASRLRAADRIISHAKSLTELEEMEVRLQRLEEIAAGLGGTSSRQDREAA